MLFNACFLIVLFCFSRFNEGLNCQRQSIHHELHTVYRVTNRWCCCTATKLHIELYRFCLTEGSWWKVPIHLWLSFYPSSVKAKQTSVDLFLHMNCVTLKCVNDLTSKQKEKQKSALSLTFLNHCVLFSIVLSRCCSFWADHSPSTGGESLCTMLAPPRDPPYCSDPPLWHPSSSGRMKV